MLCKIFGPERLEVTGDWRQLHNEQLYDMYWSPYTIQMIKTRRMRSVGHVARMGDRICECRVFGRKIWGKVATWKTLK